jgi:hypothetical protein
VRKFLFALLCLLAGTASAGELFTFIFVGGQVNVASVNTTTGAVTPSIQTTAPSYSQSGATVDTAGGRIFFKSGTQLYIVDTVGKTFTILNVGACCPVLVFDPFAQRLYGLDPTLAGMNVLDIDLQTGATSVVATTAPTPVALVQAAIDARGRRLYFVGSNTLNTVNLQTGTGTAVPLTACCAGLQFDPLAGTLYGLDSSGPQLTVVVLDPATGQKTPVANTTSPGVTLLPFGFDPVGRVIYFENGTQQRLYSVALQPGVVTSTPLSSTGPLFFVTATLAIPTVGEYGLLLLVASFALLACLRLR